MEKKEKKKKKRFELGTIIRAMFLDVEIDTIIVSLAEGKLLCRLIRALILDRLTCWKFLICAETSEVVLVLSLPPLQEKF